MAVRYQNEFPYEHRYEEMVIVFAERMSSLTQIKASRQMLSKMSSVWSCRARLKMSLKLDFSSLDYAGLK
jgi:hypothetical protein